ncbi:MAG: single-stranded DNA-binding protein [Candidatus Margulisiibacteriota bacterium]|nr:MAG: single-stranded DNA-binding protein [Candidatus Margulisiibacteriota bacterium]HCY35715.1 single-stranded DNA-binding protein [Candidatus Margulisiibacteriota bacterium]
MFNKVFIIGNLTKDPEMRYTPGGIAVTRFTIAVNRSFKKSTDSAANSEADFLRIVTWRRLAEVCGEFLKKGTSVFIEGRLQIDSYEKDGEKKISAEIIADNMQILSKKSGMTEADFETEDNLNS